MKTTRLTVWAAKVPGAAPAAVGTASTVREARQIAAQFLGRRDLRHQDVAIRRGDRLVEYAGPAR